jgi:hypothetical protein
LADGTVELDAEQNIQDVITEENNVENGIASYQVSFVRRLATTDAADDKELNRDVNDMIYVFGAIENGENVYNLATENNPQFGRFVLNLSEEVPKPDDGASDEGMEDPVLGDDTDSSGAHHDDSDSSGANDDTDSSGLGDTDSSGDSESSGD